jgi:Zn-finger nucleic acid-binding protein
MRSYERNGVTIDQCTECRGLFLDRGELERLVDAENAWHRPQEAQQQVPPRVVGSEQRYGERPRYDDDDRRQYDDRRHYDGDHYDRDHHKPKKRRGFLEDLFD